MYVYDAVQFLSHVGTVKTDDEPTRADKNHSNKLMVYLVSSLTSVVILAVAAGILVRRWQVKRQRQQQAIRSRYQSRAATDGQECEQRELIDYAF